MFNFFNFLCHGKTVYLAGFALTLMFCIARIVELMNQTVNAEDQAESLKKRVDDLGNAASLTTSIPDVADDSGKKSPGNTPYTLRKRAVTASDKTD